MSAPAWPRCLTEDETLDRMCAGASLARLGDGELAIAQGKGNSTHAPNPALAKDLRRILHDPAPGCLPAIPTMDPKSPKYGNWSRSKARFAPLFDPARVYGSAFVGRSDCAPWILRPDYFAAFRGLWAGRRVAAVCAEDHGLRKLLAKDAAHVTWVPCPKMEAYGALAAIEATCLAAGTTLAVICAGPAATVLADRLARAGLQAVDLGRGAGMLLKVGREGWSRATASLLSMKPRAGGWE
jgi:hypothetical protein